MHSEPRQRRIGARGASWVIGAALVISACALTPWTASSEAAPAASPAPRVLIVGDSTTVHMLDEFTSALERAGLDPTINAKSGRTTREGRAVLSGYDVGDFDYVVALLGANGRRANAVRDVSALRAGGVDTMATVLAPQQAIVNRAITSAFGRDRLAWAGYARRHGIATTDGKHFSVPAYRERASYLARTIAERISAQATKDLRSS